MSQTPDLSFRILTWIGIINQLSVTKANRLLGDLGLPWPQFQLLNHFSHRPDEAKTVMSIAQAMQQNQPAVSKTVKAMVQAGLLREAPAPGDGRSKLLYLTERGRATHGGAVEALMPTLREAFAGWTDDDKHALMAGLDRLKLWFDDNR